MTLIVSLRTLDGIVIAGDSLSTVMAGLQLEAEIQVSCPNCMHQHTIKERTTGGQIPSSTFSFAQKVFPFMENYGIGTFGAGSLGGKTMYFAIRELERKLKEGDHEPDGVTNASEIISQPALELVKSGIPDIDKAPDNWYAVGFQVVGYDDSEAKTIEIKVGKSVQSKTFNSRGGCTRSGEGRVVGAIWQLYKEHPEDQAAYGLFSLQDAIDYAEFLISATASYQKFSRTIPRVGGDIDIGLVTPFDGFKWIRQKPLGKIFGGDQ